MKRMLFNATHAEELRVAIVDGQKLVDIDIESAGRESRKSNIYKGVITRIEPSLEACFVNYGEERHGFLPFKEVSRMYFREGVDTRGSRIQDALKEGQEILVQLEKEERGNKGAALTTFISLAGRYLVLMPNNPKGGGVSRRIEGEERNELRDKMDQLQLPGGMSVIARTAAIDRTVEELQWDLNYLIQLWKAVDDASRSAAGAYLIYQESSLVIRAIRDYFQPEIGEILIDTDDIYEQARQFMAHVMPDMVNHVKRYRDETPLFSRFQIEHQIETAYSRTVQLPSGGSIVIDHTEALVAVDVNSARSTRGSDIEETATRTNLEAAEEVGRQMRLRDLGGLVVIDFIDMEDSKNQKAVESKLREALHFDRARVQMGKISKFGLMELSRQRLRPALSEASHVTCPRCTGTGVIRDTESTALHVLRIVQEEAMKEGTSAIHAQVPVDVATYLLNEKRRDIAKLEARHRITVTLIPNKYIETPHYKLERLKHDDARLEEPMATYAMTEVPEEVDYLTKAAVAQKEERPRQIAKVKGIVPAQPAPSRPVEATAAALAHPISSTTVPFGGGVSSSKPSFWAKWFAWLIPSKPENVSTSVIQTSPADFKQDSASPGHQKPETRTARNGRSSRTRNPRPDRQERTDSPQKTKTQPSVAELLNTPEKNVEEAEQLSRKDRSDRNRRSDRKGRGEKPLRSVQEQSPSKQGLALAPEKQAPTSTERPADLLEQTAFTPASLQLNELPEVQTNERDQERRRRRRGGRRGRAREEAYENTAQNATPVESAPESMVDRSLHENQKNQQLGLETSNISLVTATPVPESTVLVQAPETASVQAFASAPVQISEIPLQTYGYTPASASSASHSVTSVALAENKEVLAAPVTADAGKPEFRKVALVIDPAKTVLDIPALQAVVETAGLAWIHTDSDKYQQVQQIIANAAPPAYEPRQRKIVHSVSTQPLILVETRPEFRA